MKQTTGTATTKDREEAMLKRLTSAFSHIRLRSRVTVSLGVDTQESLQLQDGKVTYSKGAMSRNLPLTDAVFSKVVKAFPSLIQEVEGQVTKEAEEDAEFETLQRDAESYIEQASRIEPPSAREYE